jgi:hypothetical protein
VNASPYKNYDKLLQIWHQHIFLQTTCPHSSVMTGEYHFIVVYIVQWQEATTFLQIFPAVQDPCLLGPGEAV